MTVPKVETVYVQGDRWYVDPGTGDRVPGVSAVLNMMAKPALMRWAAKEAAIFAVENQATIGALARTDKQAAVDLIKGAPWRKSGKAADTGSQVHGLVERLMLDKRSGVQSAFKIPQGTMPYLRSYAAFLQEFSADPEAIEVTVWDAGYGYAGTLDSIFTMTVDGQRITALVDVKTGASGVWPEAALQQTAYARAGQMLDPETGQRLKMVPIDRAFALWLRPEGWALIPLSTSDRNWDQFLRLRGSYEWKTKDEKHAVGKAINAHPISKRWSP